MKSNWILWWIPLLLKKALESAQAGNTHSNFKHITITNTVYNYRNRLKWSSSISEMKRAESMLRISWLQVSAFINRRNNRLYDCCLIQDSASQVSRRLTNHLLLNFRVNHIELKISHALLTGRNTLWIPWSIVWILPTYDIVCTYDVVRAWHTTSYVQHTTSFCISYVQCRTCDIQDIGVRHRMCDIVRYVLCRMSTYDILVFHLNMSYTTSYVRNGRTTSYVHDIRYRRFISYKSFI